MKPFYFHFFPIFYLCHAYPFSHFFEFEFFLFFYHVAHHIPRRPVSFLIPRGTYTYLLPPNWHFIFYIFTSSSYTVAGLLCSWSLAGARVFGWLFFPIVSCLFLFYHGIVPPFHSPSMSSDSFQTRSVFACFSLSHLVAFLPRLYARGLFMVGGCLDWSVISPHMLELFFGSPL